MDFAFGPGNALENGGGFFLHPRRQFAFYDEFFDFLKRPVLLVMMVVVMREA